jgi:hypothetical protein
MKTITTTCAACGRQLGVPERYRGRELKCPSCGNPFRVDSAAAARPPEMAAPAAPPASPEAAPRPLPPPFTSVFEDQAATTSAPHISVGADREAPDALDTGTVYWRIRRIGVVSTALLCAVVYGMLGLLAALAVAVLSIRVAAVLPFLRGPLARALAIVVLPLLCGGAGFVIGFVMAVLYNLAARLAGGIRVLLE